MPDDRNDGRIISELLGNANGDVGTSTVVHNAQRERPPPNSPAGVELFHRELGRMLHRHPARLRERPHEP
jgi:hypothetical protein